MRVLLSAQNLKKLFNAALTKSGNRKILATELGASKRTIRDWQNGKYSLPFSAFEKLASISSINKKNLRFKKMPDFWHTKKAGQKGALVIMNRYGNIGTPEGRKRGGFASLKTHKIKQTGFKVLKSILKPRHSEKLAEFLGILIGDGHLSEYQLGITTNAQTDKEHALISHKFIKDLFGISSTLKIRSEENTVTIVASSKSLVEFLNRLGMPIGNKIQKHLEVPKWILKKELYQKAFIRGLFDTDGCIYLDTHKIKGKLYKHFGWTITSYAGRLINGIIEILKGLGFSPTYRTTQKSVYLRKQKEIARYFKEIGTHNPKHHKRYQKLNGRVPKWS